MWHLANEFGRLAQGVGTRIKGTNTIHFIQKNQVPQERVKDVTYGSFSCDFKPNKESKIIPGLWTHNTRPILFSLVADDFAVKYTRKEDAEHLLNVLKKDYIATEDWEGQKCLGFTIEWNYENGQVHL